MGLSNTMPVMCVCVCVWQVYLQLRWQSLARTQLKEAVASQRSGNRLIHYHYQFMSTCLFQLVITRSYTVHRNPFLSLGDSQNSCSSVAMRDIQIPSRHGSGSHSQSDSLSTLSESDRTLLSLLTCAGGFALSGPPAVHNPNKAVLTVDCKSTKVGSLYDCNWAIFQMFSHNANGFEIRLKVYELET